MAITIVFDRVFVLLDELVREARYPPYGIERIEDDHRRISPAFAGFTCDSPSHMLHYNLSPGEVRQKFTTRLSLKSDKRF